MRKHLRYTVSLGVLAALTLGGPAWSNEIAANVSTASIDGAGRNLMRTADGGIVAAFSTTKSSLIFGRSLDNGASWSNVPVKDVNGSIVQVAIDSNFQGSYIAFTEKVEGRVRGRIAFSLAPFGSDPQLEVSAFVTPEGVVPQDTFIQASRAGWGDRASKDRETVVYGWQDSVSKSLYIGVSPDGRTFPMAQPVVKDPFAASGPAVAIRGKYVVATYKTANPAMAPKDVPAATRNGRTYPAWVESFDGGLTWSEPRPLFGLTTAAFPKVRVESPGGSLAVHRLAGGSVLPNSPILNWAASRDFDLGLLEVDKTLPVGTQSIDRQQVDLQQINRLRVERLKLDRRRVDRQRRERRVGTAADPDPNRTALSDPEPGGTTFVQSSMRSLDGDGADGEVSIVSFRPIEPGAAWTHVIANNPLTADRARVDGATSHLNAQGTQFQYSALIDTAVRATTYQEVDPATRHTRLVAAVSTDTGKSFKHHVSFTREQLARHGIPAFQEGSIFAVSQCLFEDRDGEVYVDVLVASDGKMQFASLPIGVNAATLRAEERLKLAAR